MMPSMIIPRNITVFPLQTITFLLFIIFLHILKVVLWKIYKMEIIGHIYIVLKYWNIWHTPQAKLKCRELIILLHLYEK